jgi:hypothetical protein
MQTYADVCRYIASNLVGVLSKSMSVENDLRVALALDLDAELKALAQVYAALISLSY